MTHETAFETEGFDTAFDTAVANCTELTRAETAHFVEHGYVVIRWYAGLSGGGRVRTIRAFALRMPRQSVDEDRQHAPRGR